MAERLPRVTGTEILRAFERAGWQRVHQVGSHVKLRPPQGARRVTLPIHRGKTIGPGLLTDILDQAGLSVEEFRKLL